MSRKDERAREQWFKDGDQLRHVPIGKLPEEIGVDTRMAVELPRAPEPFERFFGMQGRSVVSLAARERFRKDAAINRREWHDEVDRRLGMLEAELSRLRAILDQAGEA